MVFHNTLKHFQFQFQASVTSSTMSHANSSTVSRVDKTGRFSGTPAYMPPEAWKGEERYMDVFSYGLVAIYAITGKHPGIKIINKNMKGNNFFL